MKKKALNLNRKLMLGKSTIMQLDTSNMRRIAGGGDTIFQCASNGCSNADTLCMVDMTRLDGSPCVLEPITIGNVVCEPEISVNMCPSEMTG